MRRIFALREKAKKQKKKIVLPEGEDLRVLTGAAFLEKEKIAHVYVLGKEEDVEKMAKENSIDLTGVTIINPFTHDKRKEIIDDFYNLRKLKGVTPEEAEKILMENFIYYGAMMVRQGTADGFVAGASHPTSDVARASIQCLRLDREIGTVSSCFIMEMEDCPFGEDGMFAYADCAVIPNPNKRQLAGIAVASSDLFKGLFCVDPRVAMLSFSTKGSAKSISGENIAEALKRIKEKRPNLMIDGELQLDAAIVPEVAKRKCPDSIVGGKANVLVFPNLDAGNISYKLTQRLGKSRAVGPIILGLDKPCSDLSRGCSWEDVVDTAVVTVLRAQST